MSEPTVLYSVEGAVARITLNRPAAANAMNMELALAFTEAAQRAAADASLRCVVLTGNGRLFCGGGDLPSMGAAGDSGPIVASLARQVHAGTAALARMRKPLLVLVNGHAAGIGLSLAIAGDVVLATKSASFTAAYGGVGLTPDGGMSWMLPRLVGLRKAQEMILLNRRVPAEEAERIGLITRAVDDEALSDEGAKAAAELCRLPTAALGAARSLLLASSSSSLEEQLDRETFSIGLAASGAEFREGVAAFGEKRKPNFGG